MYDLTIGLEFDEPLALEEKYRYDFLAIDINCYSSGLLEGYIFVFRTIKNGGGAGNVLIDLIHNSNVNVFHTHMHGDCHFHVLSANDFLKMDTIDITENITFEMVKNISNQEYYAVIKEQKYKEIDVITLEKCRDIKFSKIKYLLITKYTGNNPINIKRIELSPIFNLQKDHIWHNNKYKECNRVSYLNIDHPYNYKINPLTYFKGLGEFIENEYKIWEGREKDAFDRILVECRSQRFLPIES